MNGQASTAAKIAALVMMAPAALLPIKASAQQMASSAPAPPAHVVAAINACQRLPTFLERDKCSITVAAQEHQRAAAASSQRADAGERELQCADAIKSGLSGGTYTPQRLKDVLAGRPAKEVGLCNVLAQLRS